MMTRTISRLSMALLMVLMGNTVQADSGATGATGVQTVVPQGTSGLPAHTESDGDDGTEIETEFYVGQRGYRHGGVSLSMPIGQKNRLGITAHTVREATGEPTFPSVGLQFGTQVSDGFEVEVFSFHYLPVERQKAWALGVHGTKVIKASEGNTLSLFFSPAYARVRAMNESTLALTSVDHLMLLGGLTIERPRFQASLFASQSFFNRDTKGLETHVDLEEMTHFAVYENTDGFPRRSIGTEATYAFSEQFGVTGRYAAMWFSGEKTRHSFFVTPHLKIRKRLDIFGGVQILRGGKGDNNLVMGGGALHF